MTEEKIQNKTFNDDDNEPNDRFDTDFSGSWVLQKGSENIDDYYKSEGWSYFMRTVAPMAGMEQIITQNGDSMKIQVKVLAMGQKIANVTNSTILGGSDEYEFEDDGGLQRGLSKWNEDRTKIISETYRVNDPKRTYKSVRYMVGDQMVHDTTKCHGITLKQVFERK